MPPMTTVFLVTFLLGGLAYIDPGTGSFILQFLVASTLGALFVMKSYWQKLKRFVTGLLGGS